LHCAFAVKRGLDPAYAPGTGTPEIGGYTPHEAQRMLRGLDLVGGDVVEVSPPFDMSGNTRSWVSR
jgi:guanidinopropionase